MILVAAAFSACAGGILLPKPTRPRPHTDTPQKELRTKINDHTRHTPIPTTMPTTPAPPPSHPRFTIAVVGDIHDQWNQESEIALASLNADVAVFVGDFGNENVDLVRQLASVSSPYKRVYMLGNHDSWYSLTPKGRQRAMKVAQQTSSLSTFSAVTSHNHKNKKHTAKSNNRNNNTNNNIDQMLDALGPNHIGHSALSFAQELGVAFVGGRAFSKGGSRWSDVADFYQRHYEIDNFEESAHRIVDVALSQHPHASLIVVGHNGPTGLGAHRWSPCGVDWQLPAEDFGDPDLGEALDMMASQRRPATLVLFGHMHQSLKGEGGGKRNMVAVDARTGTVFLNSAVVPRQKKFTVSCCRDGDQHETERVMGHHFMLVDMEDGCVRGARYVWVVGDGSGRIVEQEDLLKVVIPSDHDSSDSNDSNDRVVMSYYQAYTNEWVSVVVPLPLQQLKQDDEIKSPLMMQT